MTTALICGALAVAVLVAGLVRRRIRRNKARAHRLDINFNAARARELAPYVFHLVGVKRNPLYALFCSGDSARGAHADRMAKELRNLLWAKGYRQDLYDIDHGQPLDLQRFNEMMTALANDPAFTYFCARNLGWLTFGLRHVSRINVPLMGMPEAGAVQACDDLLLELNMASLDGLARFNQELQHAVS